MQEIKQGEVLLKVLKRDLPISLVEAMIAPMNPIKKVDWNVTNYRKSFNGFLILDSGELIEIHEEKSKHPLGIALNADEIVNVVKSDFCGPLYASNVFYQDRGKFFLSMLFDEGNCLDIQYSHVPLSTNK